MELRNTQSSVFLVWLCVTKTVGQSRDQFVYFKENEPGKRAETVDRYWVANVAVH